MKSMFRVILLLLAAASVLSDHYEDKPNRSNALYSSANTIHKEIPRHQAHMVKNYTGINQFSNEVLKPIYHSPHFDAITTAQSSRAPVIIQRPYIINGIDFTALYSSANTPRHQAHMVKNYTGISQSSNEVLKPRYHEPHFDTVITVQSSPAPINFNHTYMNNETDFKALNLSANTNYKEIPRHQGHMVKNYTGISKSSNKVLKPKYHAPHLDEIITAQSSQALCPLDNGFFPVPGKCDLYVQCMRGQAFVKRCPSNLHFNALFKECDVPHHAKCETKCPTEVGFFALPGHCSSYMVCSNGQPAIRTCAIGQHFNISTKRCYLPESLKCEPICTAANGKFAVRGWCDAYLYCSDGKGFISSCPSGLVFNPLLKTCDLPQNVDCQLM